MDLRVCLAALAASALMLSIDANAVDANANANINANINGWFPCAYSDVGYAGYANPTAAVFECAEVEVPLCYDGVCASDQTLSLFVKRQLGADIAPAGAKRKAVVAMQGGPGAASPFMESRIASLKRQLDGAVDYYTFDHRGTGRSEFLMCDAAQALTTGSPSGAELSLDELQNCLHDLNYQYDHQAAAFSTTSAAMDVRFLIDTFMSEHQVFLVGFSYGTYLAQRILQLNPPQVVGYVFDSVDVLTTADDPLEGAVSHWNQAIRTSGRRLLECCYDDVKCPIAFQSRATVVDDTLAFMNQLDEQLATNRCAQILVVATGYDSPSVGLRSWLSERAGDWTDRAAALEMLGYVQRCGPDDAAAMKEIFFGDGLADDEPQALDPLNDLSLLLYNVVVDSERWSQPAPMKAERNEFFFDGVFSVDLEVETLAFCTQTGSTEPACEEVKHELPKNRSETFFYARDKYYTKTLRLPDHAGALIFSGGLDFATPKEFGELLYNKLNGTGCGVMLVNFDFGVHCGGEAVDGSTDTPCYDSILAQFIRTSGVVAKVDTSCMTELPTAIFHKEEGDW